MAFYVGQKVVCVDANTPAQKLGGIGDGWARSEAPENGRTYTVTRVFMVRAVETLWLAEIERCKRAREIYGDMCGYAAIRFRPITERKTDISIFKAMLNPSKQEVSA